MADIRINSLTTTASSTASDDFIGIDGATNGTRKLNAFSPSFGGNATVAGTLTVNSTSSFAGTATIAVGNGVAATLGLNQTGVANAYLTQKATSGDLAIGNGGGDQLTIAKTTGVVSITSSTASTTTSSGALVVSGGVGVAGKLNVGGGIESTSGFFTSPSGTNINLAGGGGAVSIIASASGGGDIQLSGGVVALNGGRLTISKSGAGSTLEVNADSGYGSKIAMQRASTNRWTLEVDSSDVLTLKSLGTTAALTATSTTITVNHSTASTSTSSGALVVSGGVGVAGAINCGSGLVANPLFTQTRKLEAQIPHTVSTEDYLRIGSNSGSTNTYAGEFGYGLTAAGDPQIRFNRVHAGTVTTWLTVPTSTGNAEFAGSVKTAAPSGGTAANWKLGTVATVSPTSPNRTIEVDVGGTIYYIHAKTTNN